MCVKKNDRKQANAREQKGDEELVNRRLLEWLSIIDSKMKVCQVLMLAKPWLGHASI